MSIEAQIKKAEDVPITDEDILKITDKQVKIVLYHQLANLRTIMDLFIDTDKIILFYELAGEIGHWVALIHNPKTMTIVFYNSYGLLPDAERSLYKHPEPILSKLLAFRPSSYKLDINRVQHQIYKNHVNTCGRHAALRCLYSDLSNADYDQMIKTPIRLNSVDELVSVMTMVPLKYTIAKE